MRVCQVIIEAWYRIYIVFQSIYFKHFKIRIFNSLNICYILAQYSQASLNDQIFWQVQVIRIIFRYVFLWFYYIFNIIFNYIKSRSYAAI